MLRLRPLDQWRGDQWIGWPRAERRAILGQHAYAACGFSRVTHAAPVEDHPVAQQGPLAALDQLADRVLDLDRVLFGSPAPATHQAAEMSVDSDSRNVECVAE